MKKIFMVTLAAVLIISAAGCAKKTAQQENPASPVQEETIVPETPAEPEDLQENVIHITPNQNGVSDGLETSWLDEPETIQTDLEEIVSCTYTLPHLTLGTSDASAAANTVFDDLSQTVISYAQETVYPAAQEKGAIGYVNGGYSISEEDGAVSAAPGQAVNAAFGNGQRRPIRFTAAAGDGGGFICKLNDCFRAVRHRGCGCFLCVGQFIRLRGSAGVCRGCRAGAQAAHKA